jgi:hypothetical protein
MMQAAAAFQKIKLIFNTSKFLLEVRTTKMCSLNNSRIKREALQYKAGFLSPRVTLEPCCMA